MDTRRIKKALRHPRYILANVLEWGFVNHTFSDVSYLKLMYRFRTGRKLDWDNPRRFNEKIQRLKLLNNSDFCTRLVDKVGIKEYVTEKLGEGYVFPNLGVYNSFEEIDFDSLPDQFVLKTTHDSGTVVIVKNKAIFDKEAANKKLTKALSRNYYWEGRELPYKNVKPRIVAEPYMTDGTGGLNDYKFFCFDGKPTYLFYASERDNPQGLPPKFDFYDMELNHLPIQCNGHENSKTPLVPFPEFEQMKKIAAVLSEGFPHVRVDLYLINHRIYVGEMTFHHDGGFVSFIPDEWDYTFGEHIDLKKLINIK